MKQELLKTFIELIKINEVYPHEKEVISYVEKYCEEIGIQTKRDSFNNVIAYIPGDGNAEPILLNTHLDIPESVDNLEYEVDGDIVSGTGKSILGADPKSGLAVLLELAKHIVNEEILTRPIELVFTRGEEQGCHGAEHLDYSLLKSKTGLVIDEDGPFTNVVIQGPSKYVLDIKIIGKIVHPRDHAEGINALEIAAHALSKLQQGEIIEGVTFNVGKLTAGTARNTVPGVCTLEAELRSFDARALEASGKKVEETFKIEADKKGAKIEIEGGMMESGYKFETSDPLFELLEKTYASFQVKPNYYSTFGLSDANVFNAHGIRAVPIGSAYYNAHQYSEYVNLAEMEDLLKFLIAVCKN